MLIDDLIEQLQRIRAEYGNIDVAYAERCEGCNDYSVSDVLIEHETKREYICENGVPIATGNTYVDKWVVLS